ncbi:MAG: MopE-related protein, partial [Salinimicrobium sediminis]|nr:MopE-related protein [Salinimicrobium sediminis]
MRKIILLLMILFGMPLHSQTSSVCENVQVAVQVNSSTCPNAPALQVDVLFFPSENQIQFVVVNLINTSTLEEHQIEFPNPDPSSSQVVGVSQIIGSLIAGDQYEIESLIYSSSGETFCPVPGSPFLIPECSSIDQDGDNFTADVDCDDRNSNIFPGATEICNHKDDDCDGTIDEDVNYIYYWDEDDDGYGDESRPVSSCSSTATNKLSTNSTDCNDQDDTVNPGANEICGNNIDDNCDGNIDEGCSCPDADNDGICDADDNCPNLANPSQEPDVDCDGVPTIIDCDDTDNTITSTNENDADCDGVPTGLDCDDSDDTVTNTNENDADCDGVPTSIDCDDSDDTITSTNENDADCDGVPTGLDCDDSDDTITSTNENDADCDGVPTGIDCDDSDDTITSTNENDADCDGIPTSEDCNDNDPNIGSNANDTDCDGYLDFEDCDDENPDINPGSAEVCGNGLDDNCNGEVDEDCGCPGDADCDGYLTAEDCDDTNPDVNPGSTEQCNNGIDDNCDSQVNENCNTCIDDDADGICDDIDNCPSLFNPEQKPDGDCDGIPTGIDCNDNDATVLDRLDVDTDEDGIADCNDQEVNSPCPLLVDMKGVSIDSDNDGVPNCLDECPNDRNSTTAPCLCTSTKDTDNDGVSDCYDLELRSPCPGEVNTQGVSKDD